MTQDTQRVVSLCVAVCCVVQLARAGCQASQGFQHCRFIFGNQVQKRSNTDECHAPAAVDPRLVLFP